MLSLPCNNTIQSFTFLHNFNRPLLYSTKSTNQSFANYLVNSLDFSDEEALSTSAKHPSKNAKHFKSSDNANSVVDFLKRHGFDDTHVKKLVSSYPRILSADVDKTLIPKFQVLQDLGFSGSDLVALFSWIPSYSGTHMAHIIHDLRAILGSNDNLLKFIARAKFFISTSSLVNLNSNIALLKNEYGVVDTGVIRNSILLQPRSYLRDTEFFRNILVRVEEEMGIPRTSGMFLYGLHVLSQSSKKVIESKCQVFKSFGWTEYHVSELMKRNPFVIQISEKNIKKKLSFLMTELGYNPDYLASHSALFSYSLEKRMVPRRRVLLVLKEKGLLLNYNFYTAAKKTEKQFLKKYIEPYMEDAPGLLELYQVSKGSSKIQALS